MTWFLMRCRASRGFTLIELVVTLAILGVLASLVVPVAQVHVQRTKENELRLALREIRAAVDAYKRSYDEGRLRREVNASGYPKTLSALVEGQEDQRDPNKRHIYFLRRVPRDPFESNRSVPDADTWATRSYANGPDDFQGGADVYDVRTRSPLTGLNGVPLSRW